MIKVFLHISVHIGTKLSELAFPGTERHTRGKGSWGLTPIGVEVRDRAGHRGRTPPPPLSETSMGERAGQGRQAWVTWNLPIRSQGFSLPPHFTRGKRGPNGKTGPNVPKQADGREQGLL